MSSLPEISSDWRVLYRPEKTGRYINDNSVIRGPDGRWHVFGITRPEPKADPEQERYFAHGSGEVLWGEPFIEHGPVCNDGVRAWAPGVVAHGNRFFMFYGPSPTKLAVSRDIYHWIGETISISGAPTEACHRDHMVLAIGPSKWLLYATGLDEEGLGAIHVFESNDLRSWRYLRIALRTAGSRAIRCAWGATESPFVFMHDGRYFLSITYTDCAKESYHDTVLFRSDDPLDFGTYDADAPEKSVVRRFHAHAPEFIHDPHHDAWYITTCGWPGFDVPHEGAVSIARLEWKK